MCTRIKSNVRDRFVNLLVESLLLYVYKDADVMSKLFTVISFLFMLLFIDMSMSFRKKSILNHVSSVLS